MSRVKWDVSAGAVLLFALMYFFDGSGIVSAVVPAVAVHELGHLIPLQLCGHPLRAVKISVFGVEIDYTGILTGGAALLCIGGGPLSGGVYAVIACTFGGEFLRMSGAVSAVLTGFNLLPILPLDGGRIAEAVSDAAFAAKLSRWAALLLTIGGGVIALRFHVLSLLVMGTWLTVCNFRGT